MKRIVLSFLLPFLCSEVTYSQLTNFSKIHISEGAVFSTDTEIFNHGEIVNYGRLKLQNNLQNNSFFISNGILIIEGENTLEVSGNTAELAHLVLNGDVILKSGIKITGSLNFLSGYILTDTNTAIEFGPQATYVNAGDKSHIIGRVIRSGNGPFRFPLGNGEDLRAIEIDEQNGLPVLADYKAENPLNLSISTDAEIESVNNLEYWRVFSSGLTRIQITGSESVYLNDHTVWAKLPEATNSGPEGLKITSGKHRNIVKGLLVWPNPTNGEFSLAFTGMNDDDEVTADIIHQDGHVIRHLEGTVKNLRKIYKLPDNLAASSLKIRVVNHNEVFTQTLLLHK